MMLINVYSTTPNSSQLRTESFLSLSLCPQFSCEESIPLCRLRISLSLPRSSEFSTLLPNPKMNKSGLIAASVAAASAISISSSSSSINSSSYACNPCMQDSRQDGVSHRDHENSSSLNSSSKEKFAPRFDGLRFIETLVTAHR